jgi:Rap1a immunity proteins
VRFIAALAGLVVGLSQPAMAQSGVRTAAQPDVRTAAQSNVRTAGIMLPACREFLGLVNGETPTQPVTAGICAGMVAATLDYSALYVTQFRFCKPASVTNTQAVAVAVKALDATPELWNRDFGGLLLAVFARAWPCRS